MRKNTSPRANRGPDYRKTRKKTDIVQQVCNKLGLRAIALFRKAFRWKHGHLDQHQVGVDLKKFQQSNGRRLAGYVLRFIKSLEQSKAIPA
ncbi:hypothetical protein KJ819_00730 [Patescibacteria group bacterium]|nr:hypothetical protein [Patescibacteria group bacterium]MBU1500656.1 hypothetical protein [Patescibacteria group bacterium]MBU2080391.1 hypothetical protein [Patescibacteria group bacterium]MBU2124197.1 hypothetical protein [Patescibacteria group bacterium]MBU2194352.1 hypothetical protein [Patescibacteria group bacterium]